METVDEQCNVTCGNWNSCLHLDDCTQSDAHDLKDQEQNAEARETFLGFLLNNIIFYNHLLLTTVYLATYTQQCNEMPTSSNYRFTE